MSRAEHADLENVAKHIHDLQQMVGLLLKGLPRTKTWQRQLAAHLDAIDEHLQVLRLTVSMDRPASEILQAGEGLAAACRLLRTAMSGSRIDLTTRAALRLVGDLAERIRRALAAHSQ